MSSDSKKYRLMLVRPVHRLAYILHKTLFILKIICPDVLILVNY